MDAKTALLTQQSFFANKDHSLWRLFAAPGRINLIGEHTDYNQGYVMPAAIEQRVFLAIQLRSDDKIRLSALDLAESIEASTQNIQPLAGGHWANYVLGPVVQCQQRHISVPGFEAAIWSTLPVGAGLSSSAALEVATLTALNQVLRTGITPIELAKMAQAAEHAFAAVQCGIMDMYASLMGRKNQFIQLDCRNLQHLYHPYVTSDYTFLLFDTGVKHALASSAYNQRRHECEQAVALLQQAGLSVQSLRDASMDMLIQHVAAADPVAFKRAAFVLSENDRVIKAAQCLEAEDWVGLGACLSDSHLGLQHEYEVSCTEADFLANQLTQHPAVAGARMMGGGFGGCVLALVQLPQVSLVQDAVCSAYHQSFGAWPRVYPVSPAAGAGEIAS